MGLMCTPRRVVEGVRGDICKRPGGGGLSYVVAELFSVAAVREPRSLRLPWALLPSPPARLLLSKDPAGSYVPH